MTSPTPWHIDDQSNIRDAENRYVFFPGNQELIVSAVNAYSQRDGDRLVWKSNIFAPGEYAEVREWLNRIGAIAGEITTMADGRIFVVAGVRR